jgi:hypothetical protein
MEEFDVETQLGLNILKFRMPILGQGFNTGASLVFAIPLFKSNTLGIGGSYQYKSEFEPINLTPIKSDTSLKFDPGDEIGVNISYVYDPNSYFNLSFDLMYNIYSRDKINNTEIFQSGNRISILAQLFFLTNSLRHTLVLQDKIRSANSQLIDNQWFETNNGQQIDALYDLTIPINSYFSLAVQGSARYYGAGQENWNGIIINTGNSLIYGGGLFLQLWIRNIRKISYRKPRITGKIQSNRTRFTR